MSVKWTGMWRHKKKTPVSLPWIGFLLTLQCETGLHLCAPLACGLETFRLYAPRQRASMKHQELIYISFITYVRPSWRLSIWDWWKPLLAWGLVCWCPNTSVGPFPIPLGMGGSGVKTPTSSRSLSNKIQHPSWNDAMNRFSEPGNHLIAVTAKELITPCRRRQYLNSQKRHKP
jgi:hypothetical protein